MEKGNAPTPTPKPKRQNREGHAWTGGCFLRTRHSQERQDEHPTVVRFGSPALGSQAIKEADESLLTESGVHYFSTTKLQKRCARVGDHEPSPFSAVSKCVVRKPRFCEAWALISSGQQRRPLAHISGNDPRRSSEAFRGDAHMDSGGAHRWSTFPEDAHQQLSVRRRYGQDDRE